MLAQFLFGHHLTAGATGAGGNQSSFGVTTHNSHGINSFVWILGTCGEEGCPFGTEAAGIGDILLVAAPDNGSVGETQGGTDMEVGIGGVGGGGGLDGRLHQLAIGIGQLG